MTLARLYVRWVVERTFAWLHHYKRLLVRYDRRHDIHEGVPRPRVLSRLLQEAPTSF